MPGPLPVLAAVFLRAASRMFQLAGLHLLVLRWAHVRARSRNLMHLAGVLALHQSLPLHEPAAVGLAMLHRHLLFQAGILLDHIPMIDLLIHLWLSDLRIC